MNWPLNAHGLHLPLGDCLLNVKLLDLQAAYMVKAWALEPNRPLGPHHFKASKKWLILDPRAKVAEGRRKRIKGGKNDDDDDDDYEDAVDGEVQGSAGRCVLPEDHVPLTFWSPGKGFYQELIHRFNAGAVIDLTAVDNVSAIASVPQGLAWTAVAQTAAHAAHLRARVAAGLFNAMLDSESPLFSAELSAACQSITDFAAGSEPQPKEITVITPKKDLKAATGLNMSLFGAASKKKNRSEWSHFQRHVADNQAVGLDVRPIKMFGPCLCQVKSRRRAAPCDSG